MSNRTYKYAVVPSQGTYGSDSKVYATYRSDDLDRAKAKAAKLTRDYQRDMRPHGGSSGGYRVIAWDQEGVYLGYGHEADRRQSI